MQKSVGVRFRVVQSESDIPPVVDLAREAHDETPLRQISFNPEKVKRSVAKVLKDRRSHLGILAELEEHPAGLIYCALGEYYLGSDALVLSIHSLYVQRCVRHSLTGGKVAVGLLRRALAWGKQNNTVATLAHATSGIELTRSDAFFRKAGFGQIGGNYLRMET